MSGLTTSASCEGNLEWWKLILPSFFWSSLPVGTVRDKIVSGLAGCWQELWVTSSQEDVCVQNNGRLFVSAYSQFVLCRARRAVMTGARLDETEDEPLAGKHVWAVGGEKSRAYFLFSVALGRTSLVATVISFFHIRCPRWLDCLCDVRTSVNGRPIIRTGFLGFPPGRVFQSRLTTNILCFSEIIENKWSRTGFNPLRHTVTTT